MDHAPRPPLPADRQPGFGPREIDPPVVEGYEPDIAPHRQTLMADQPKTETMEAADTPQVDEEWACHLDEAPIARLGPSVGMPQAALDAHEPLQAAVLPADEPEVPAKVDIEPAMSRPG